MEADDRRGREVMKLASDKDNACISSLLQVYTCCFLHVSLAIQDREICVFYCTALCSCCETSLGFFFCLLLYSFILIDGQNVFLKRMNVDVFFFSYFGSLNAIFFFFSFFSTFLWICLLWIFSHWLNKQNEDLIIRIN